MRETPTDPLNPRAGTNPKNFQFFGLHNTTTAPLSVTAGLHRARQELNSVVRIVSHPAERNPTIPPDPAGVIAAASHGAVPARQETEAAEQN